MKYFKDVTTNTEKRDLRDAIEYRYFNTLKQRALISKRNRFIQNFLVGNSFMSETLQDNSQAPFKFSNFLNRIKISNYGNYYTDNEIRDYSRQFVENILPDERYDDSMNWYDLRIPLTRKVSNNLLVQSLDAKPTFKLRDFSDDIRSEMLSYSLNFLLQRMLYIGDFYDYFYPLLEMKTISEGTSYTRVDYDLSFDMDGEFFIEDYNFKIVPMHRIIDDGKYIDNMSHDLEHNEFVIQEHVLDKSSATRMLQKLKVVAEKIQEATKQGSSDYFGGYLSHDVEDLNKLWDLYGIERYRTITILEVFWKDYEVLNGEYEWRRTFFSITGDTLDELITIPSQYSFGLPYLRHKHELTSDSGVGYSPIHDIMTVEVANSSLLSQQFNYAEAVSSPKIFMSSHVGNLVDENGMYLKRRGFQVFPKVRVGMRSGQTINNMIGQMQYTGIDSQGINILDKVKQETSALNDINPAPPNRMSSNSYSQYLALQNIRYQPMYISKKLYMTTLGKKLYTIIPNEYSNAMFTYIKNTYRTYTQATDLYFNNIRENLPTDLVDLGLKVSLSVEEDAIRNKSLETLLPLIQSLGPQVLYDENMISLLKLRDQGISLPGDAIKRAVNHDLNMILSGQVSLETVDNFILKTIRPEVDELGNVVTNPETGEIIKRDIYNIQDHTLIVNYLKTYFNNNKVMIQELQRSVQDVLYRYYDLHETGQQQQNQIKLMQQQAIMGQQQ